MRICKPVCYCRCILYWGLNMSESRVAKSSGRLPVLVLNTMLKLSIKPELAVEGGHLHKSRRSMDRWGTWMPSVSGVTVKKEVLAGVPCEVHMPDSAPSNRVILYMHGGGFALGSPASHRNLVSRLAQLAGMKAISMNYRKAPEHPFPAAITDTVAVYRHCMDQGLKPSNIVFCGDSAGGNLVLTTLLKLKQDSLPLPAAGCCISPWCDLTMKAASIQGNAATDLILTPQLLQQFADQYVPATERSQPLISPVFGDLAGLPPLLIQVGSSEILLDDARNMAARARQAQVSVELEVWEDMQHVWHYTALFLKDGRRALQRISDFFKASIASANDS